MTLYRNFGRAAWAEYHTGLPSFRVISVRFYKNRCMNGNPLRYVSLTQRKHIDGRGITNEGKGKQIWVFDGEA
jgi:hypothetical protein